MEAANVHPVVNSQAHFSIEAALSQPLLLLHRSPQTRHTLCMRRQKLVSEGSVVFVEAAYHFQDREVLLLRFFLGLLMRKF